MLRDPNLRSELEALIRDRHYSPEYAISRTLRRYAKVFQTVQSSFLADRASDIFDIEKRLLRHLLGRRREELSRLISPVIVLAHNLTPSETANLDRKFVRGFVTEMGGPRQPHGHRGRGARIAGGRRHRTISVRRLGRRPDHYRRRPGPRDPATRRRKRSINIERQDRAAARPPPRN